MTNPVTLTPDHFTPQHGFVEGVVLQIARRSTPPYFDDGIMIYGELDRVRDGVIAVGGTLIRIGDIVSISILTGPMRFWSWAPGWATHHIYLQADAKSEFFNDSGFGEWKKYGPLRPVTLRPWWCDFGKEG